MHRTLGMCVVCAVLFAAGACKKKNEASQGAAPAAGTTTASAATTDTAAAAAGAADPGIEAGPIEREASEGPAAVLAAVSGTVEVRRVGETAYQAAAADTPLFPGDQVRTGDQSTATIAMADESVIEVAEVSTVGIASREGGADPASTAAVLAGLARFTVTPRAPGEGAFKVYTPGGVVMTRGTVYAIGVAASGSVRVGVESGAVDVVGLAATATEPVAVETGHATTMTAEGSVGASSAWAADDWGAWRAEADAAAGLDAAITAHGEAMTTLGASLTQAYADLEAQAAAMAELEAKAATAAETQATAEYEVVAPEAAATIDASFGVAAHAEALTWAYAGRATLAEAIYVRHPDEVKAKWEVVAPRVEASVLWPKRFVVTSSAYLEPLRMQYYVHHPRGRAHASLVGVAVPEFYGKVDVPEPEPAKVSARVKTRVWVAPAVRVKPQARPVWIAAPDASWKAKVKVKPAPVRAKVGWYVRPPDIKASVLVGAASRATWKPGLAVAAPASRASLRARVKVKPVGARINVSPPDLDAAARARMNVKLGNDGRLVGRPTAIDHRAPGHGAVKGTVGAGAGAGAKAAADAKAKADIRAKADVKLKVPPPPPPPKAKIEVKGKLDVKGALGN